METDLKGDRCSFRRIVGIPSGIPRGRTDTPHRVNAECSWYCTDSRVSTLQARAPLLRIHEGGDCCSTGVAEQSPVNVDIAVSNPCTANAVTVLSDDKRGGMDFEWG